MEVLTLPLPMAICIVIIIVLALDLAYYIGKAKQSDTDLGYYLSKLEDQHHWYMENMDKCINEARTNGADTMRQQMGILVSQAIINSDKAN